MFQFAEPQGRLETIRIRKGQLESLRKLNRILYDAGARRPSERRDGTAIAVREMILTCLRLQNPTARVVLQSQIDEMEGTIESQRAMLKLEGDLALSREAVAKEARRRVSSVETRNRDLRAAIQTLCDWLAVSVSGKGVDTDAVSRRAFKAVAARTEAACVASAEGRTLSAEEEERFVKNLLPEGCGKALVRRESRPFPTDERL